MPAIAEAVRPERKLIDPNETMKMPTATRIETAEIATRTPRTMCGGRPRSRSRRAMPAASEDPPTATIRARMPASSSVRCGSATIVDLGADLAGAY